MPPSPAMNSLRFILVSPGYSSFSLVACGKVHKLCGAFGSGHCESGFPRAFVVVQTAPSAFHDDFSIREVPAPKRCPNVIDEKENCGMLFEISWKVQTATNQTMGEFMNQRGLLCVGRIARAQLHRPLEIAGKTGSLVNDDSDWRWIESEFRRLLHGLDDTWPLCRPDLPIFFGRRLKLFRLRLELQGEFTLLGQTRRPENQSCNQNPMWAHQVSPKTALPG